MNIDIEICISAMRKSLLLKGQALQIELAVGLLVYESCNSTDRDAKKQLREIYAAAGQADCLKYGNPDYATVQRRMDRIALLRDIVRHVAIKRWIRGKEGQEAIDAIIEGIAPMRLQSMDDILKAAGKPRKKEERKAEPHQAQRLDAEYVYRIEMPHLFIGIPKDAEPSELIAAAERLFEIANELEAKANKEQLQPEDDNATEEEENQEAIGQ